jgi:hypothetical protein
MDSSQTLTSKPPPASADKRGTIVPVETENAREFPRPTAQEFQNPQLNLFQDFLCNNAGERNRLSHVIDLWDHVPRYGISRQAMNRARHDDKFLSENVAEFQYKGRTFKRVLFPAKVRDASGAYRDYFASANEELVEDALRKLAAEQNSGYFSRGHHRSGVVFSLYMLREELKRRGHARSYQEIVLSLNILSRSSIEISAPAEGDLPALKINSTYLPTLAAVSKDDWMRDPKAKWVVQFHALVTASIDQVTYRQYNYHVMMSHSTQLARWLHKQLALKYTFAGWTDPFEMRFSTIKRDSGLLESFGRERKAIEAVVEALNELKANSVLGDIKREDIRGLRGKILDVIFTLMPSKDFIHDTKAGNKRLKEARDIAQFRDELPFKGSANHKKSTDLRRPWVDGSSV